MSRNNRAKRESRKTRYAEQEMLRSNSRDDNVVDMIEYKAAAAKPIETLTAAQAIHKSALLHDDLVIAIGSAGTGKTWLSAAVTAELYKGGHVKTIVMTRPNQEVGKSLGYLPGELDDKYAPYLEPFKKGLIERLGSNKFQADFKRKILAKPLQYMRGETYDNAVMLLDEAQNTTVVEMKMFLTRAGIGTRIFISGDVNQTDLTCKESGLAWLVRQIRDRKKNFEIVEYRRGDCVRSGLCLEMLDLIEGEV